MLVEYTDAGVPYPTIKLLISLHDCAMALNSLERMGLAGDPCCDVISALHKTADRLAPLGWMVPQYSWGETTYEHVKDLRNLDIWGQLGEWVSGGLRPATEIDILFLNLVEVGYACEEG